MKNLRFLSLALLVLPVSHAFSEPVLARVLDTSGSVSGTSSSGDTIAKGSTLAAGATNTTGPGSQISFTPFPGAVVTYAADTKASIERIDLDRADTSVVRSATFRLEEGTLFFAVDKVNWKTTTFEMLVPDGKVLAQAPQPPKTATAGVVVVRNGKHCIAAEAGNISFVGANGNAIVIASGSVLSANGEGFNVVNLTTGQVTAYDSKGSVLGVHMASATELQSATEIYASATDLTETLIANGTINQEVAKEIGQTLIEVNQELVALGATPVDGGAVGALPSGGAGSLPALSGAPGANTANPANTSGQVNSREN